MECPNDARGTVDPLALAGTLCARLCHDLAGTLGALSGMLDLQRPDGTPDAEALAVARTCASELANRLRLLRAAWGTDSEVGELSLLKAGLPGADRLHVDVSGVAVETDPARQRLAAALLLVAASGLPRGGAIRLGRTQHGLIAMIEGPRAGWPQSVTGCLAPGGLALTAMEPRGVATAMLCLQAQALGLALHLPSEIEMELRPSRQAETPAA